MPQKQSCTVVCSRIVKESIPLPSIHYARHIISKCHSPVSCHAREDKKNSLQMILTYIPEESSPRWIRSVQTQKKKKKTPPLNACFMTDVPCHCHLTLPLPLSQETPNLIHPETPIETTKIGSDGPHAPPLATPTQPSMLRRRRVKKK